MNSDRRLHVADPSERTNLAAFASRVLRLDPTSVLRLRMRGVNSVTVWAPTTFDVLAVRVINGTVSPPDASVAADTLVNELATANSEIELGYSMDSAWRGGLPPESGWVHLDDVPSSSFSELAAKGAEVTQDAGAPGPPKSLLDQPVLTVSSVDGSVEVPMRAVFALTAMAFSPVGQSAEIVRVRKNRAWVRLDARFGSVAYRTGGLAVLA